MLLAVLRLLALGELLHELVEGLLQVLGELLHLFVRRVALDRLLEAVLGCAQGLLGIRQVAVLDLEGHLPQQIGDAGQIRVGLGRAQAVGRGGEPEEDRGLRREALRGDAQGVERRLDAGAILVGGGDEAAALLGERPGERLREDARRQHDLGGLRAALLAGLVAHHQGQFHPGAGPGIVGEVDERLGVGLAERVGGQRQPDLGHRHEGAAGLQRLDQPLGGGDAVIVLGAVGEVEGAPPVHFEAADLLHLRGPVGDRLDHEALRLGARGGDAEFGRTADKPEALLPQGRAGGGSLRRGCGARRGGFVLGHRHQGGIRRQRRLALAGDAHDQRGIDRRAQALHRVRGIAGHRDDQRRHAGVDRWVDPAVDAEARRGGGRLAPVEGGRDAPAPFGAGDEEGGERGDEEPRAQGQRIVAGHVGAWPPGPQPGDGGSGP